MEYEQPVTGMELERARDKLLNFIFPNEPRGSAFEAFERAVIAQAEWEKRTEEKLDGLPPPVTGLRVGNFSATMKPRTGWELAPEARGILLRAGLLYKGVGPAPSPWEGERICLGPGDGTALPRPLSPGVAGPWRDVP